MGILLKKNHICDNNCPSCDKRDECDHVNYKQFGFAFDLDAENIDWDNIPEVDVEPNTSDYLTQNEDLHRDPISKLQEIEIADKKEELEKKKSQRIINEFLKSYSAKLLKWSLIAIIVLYILDMIISTCGLKNSEFADRLFTLLQMIITTIIGYLIGSNQEKE